MDPPVTEEPPPKTPTPSRESNPEVLEQKTPTSSPDTTSEGSIHNTSMPPLETPPKGSPHNTSISSLESTPKKSPDKTTTPPSGPNPEGPPLVTPPKGSPHNTSISSLESTPKKSPDKTTTPPSGPNPEGPPLEIPQPRTLPDIRAPPPSPVAPPVLYMVEASPGVRAVLMTAKAIGLNLGKRRVSLLKGEHLTPEYLEMNPQHTVPVLREADGFVLADSHAIMPYLVEKYSRDDTYYPKDTRKRAMVDQRLHFNNSTLYSQLLNIFIPILHKKKNTIDDDDKARVYNVYRLLNIFLRTSEWFAGNSITIADFAFYATLSSVNVWIPINDNYLNLKQWKDALEVEKPTIIDVNKAGLQKYTNFYKQLLPNYPTN